MKLNIGCGNKRKEGFVGVDKFPCDAVDTLADINKTLPFDANVVDEIWLDNVIEHVTDISHLMAEMHRICKRGAKISIITPHYTSPSSWRDPTHLHHLSFFSMDHFEKSDVAHYTGGGYRVANKKLSFSGGIMGLIGRLIFMLSPRQYESRWCFIFRAGTLRFELIVLKDNPDTAHNAQSENLESKYA